MDSVNKSSSRLPVKDTLFIEFTALYGEGSAAELQALR
jgi:hypothetical protein